MNADRYFDLNDKVALVTGGSRGLGYQMVKAFAEQGADVIIASRKIEACEQAATEVRAMGRRALAFGAHVGRWQEIDALIEAAYAEFGRIDILVNNAGIAGPTKRITDMSLAEWQEVIDIDLTGAWLASRAVIPQMDKQRSGNILMISSGAGRRGYPLRSPYAAAKWAMIGLTQTLAGEWGQRGIRVNCICPGAIEGDRIERVFRARAEALKQPYEVVKAGFLSQAALQRMATEEEVARVSLFLVTEVSAGVTGQTINVDCGSIMN